MSAEISVQSSASLAAVLSLGRATGESYRMTRSASGLRFARRDQSSALRSSCSIVSLLGLLCGLAYRSVSIAPLRGTPKVKNGARLVKPRNRVVGSTRV